MLLLFCFEGSTRGASYDFIISTGQEFRLLDHLLLKAMMKAGETAASDKTGCL